MKKNTLSVIFIFILFFKIFSFDLVVLEDDYKYFNLENRLEAHHYVKVDEISETGSEPGELLFPQGIQVINNQLIIADSGNNRLSIFRDGDFYKIIEGFKNPEDLFHIKGTNRVIVSDTEDYSVRINLIDGTEILKYGGVQGYKDLNFGYPGGIFMDDNYDLYVTDRVNDNIKIIDRFGRLNNLFDEAGIEKGKLNEPADIFINSEGEIYVTLNGSDRIDVFSDSFKFLFSIGGRGINPMQFRGPYGIAGDFSDNIYVCDQYNGRVQKFDKDGTLMAVFGQNELKHPRKIFVAEDGKVYVSDVSLNKIIVFSPELFKLGRKYLIEEDYDKALKLLKKSVKIDNNNFNAYYYIGYIYYKTNQLNELKKTKDELELKAPRTRAFELVNMLWRRLNKWGESR
ncbi:MAG: tetratricopeptide repeat protein [Candidatus Muiribacteriota bacterium]